MFFVTGQSALPDRWWHIQARRIGQTERVFLNDLDLEQLKTQFLTPLYERHSFQVGGALIRSIDDLDEVRIVSTLKTLAEYTAHYDVTTKRKGIVDRTTDRRLLPFFDGNDFTNQLLASISTKAPIGNVEPIDHRRRGRSPITKQTAMRENDLRNVFIVHGQDQGMKDAVALFVSDCRLKPIILNEQANQSRTIIEKFIAHAEVGFAIVLLSGDDEVKDGRSRARQNVIFEMGFFFSKLGRKNVAVLYRVDEKFEMPSDIHGLIYTPFDNARHWRIAIAKELKAAGYDIDLNNVNL